MANIHERSSRVGDRHNRPGELTIRETEVLALVAQGLPNKEIARILNTSTGTVNGHVHNIIRKLQVTNRTQAATWAMAHGLQNAVSFDQDNRGEGAAL